MEGPPIANCAAYIGIEIVSFQIPNNNDDTNTDIETSYNSLVIRDIRTSSNTTNLLSTRLQTF